MGYVIEHERKNTLDPNYVEFVIMNKSNHSYAINRKITEKFNSNSWLNDKCFVIGGGESLIGFDFNRLNGYHTIGTNKTFQFYPKLTINYAMDGDFYDGMKDGRYDVSGQPKIWNAWLTHGCIRVFLTPMELRQFGNEVYVVKRIFKPCVSRDLVEGIYGGRNSALGALMLAVALGSNPIYLLGYDMKVKNQSHWHNGYPNRDLKDFADKLRGYNEEIASFFLTFEKLGVKIYNLNSDSALRCFPFTDLEVALKDDA